MSESSRQEMEEVAEAYERLLVPALFEEWSQRLVHAAEIRPGQDVLDVACGTGVLARTAAERVGPDGSVAGVDANPAMVAIAERTSPAIDWLEASAEALPYEDVRFDAVVSQFGLMFFTDPEASIREMRRVLKPGGRLAVAVFDSIENLPAYAAMADVFERLVDPRVGAALRFPFSMGDTDRLASLFADASMSDAAIATREERARFSSVRHMVLADVRGWFPFAGFHLDEATLEAVMGEAERVLEPFRTPDGAVEFRVPAHLVTWRKS